MFPVKYFVLLLPIFDKHSKRGDEMKPSTSTSTFYLLLRHGYLIRRPLSLTRHSSTASLQALFEKELTSRSSNIIFDYFSPTPSHLLNLTLADFLPNSCYPPGFSKQDLKLPFAERSPGFLPQGHHLVYFSPQVPSSDLLPDGTDPLQSPGEPYDRRMWAGGSLEFNWELPNQPKLNNQRFCCTESISDVSVKGSDGNEKIFVTIERQIGNLWSSSFGSSHGGASLEQLEGQYSASVALNRTKTKSPIIETRNLVFMRQKSSAAAKEDATKAGKILKPNLEPDFSITLTPTPSLLFRFSALTFNAHAIHLDSQYCREVEGHRNLLVHGPLSLVIMLSVLRSQLKEGALVQKFDYRNLAPLYANEEMKICVRKVKDREEKYDIWIEGKEGGYAVKGSAIVK